MRTHYYAASGNRAAVYAIELGPGRTTKVAEAGEFAQRGF